MSVASRFAKLLVEGVDPQVYHTIRTAAEQRVKTLQDHVMEVAEATLDQEIFRRLKFEAETREEQANKAKKPKPAPPPPAAKPGANHVQTRLAERYSLEVTRDEITEIAGLIKTGSPTVKLIQREAQIICQYEVQVKGKRVRVVYNAKHGRIMTAVPIKEIRSGKSPVGRRKETRGNPRSMPISEI